MTKYDGRVISAPSLTSHAIERLRERSAMEPEVILSAIKNNKIALITGEQYSNRVSYLYFSDIDNTFFVLVIDVLTQEVITILPIEYWENLKRKSTHGDYRFLNGRSISKPILFEAINRMDRNHDFIKHPPLFGSKSIYFFVNYYKDDKYKLVTAGSIKIAILVSLKKGECISRLQTDFDFSMDSLVPDDGVFFVSWKTSKSKKFKFPETHQLIEFHSHIDFERLYRALTNDVSRRLNISKRFPDFDWAKASGSKLLAQMLDSP